MVMMFRGTAAFDAPRCSDFQIIMAAQSSSQYTVNQSDLKDDGLFRLNSSLSSIAGRLTALEGRASALEAANQGLFSGTVALASLTLSGKAGSLTLKDGKVVSYSAPT